jgi:hypothetical protein
VIFKPQREAFKEPRRRAPRETPPRGTPGGLAADRPGGC